MNRLRDCFSKPRLVFGGIFIVCAALIAYALFLQHVENLEPCPMCIMQRYAFVAIGFIALIATLHGPRGWSVGIYSALVSLFSLSGAGVAIRHSYLQHFPPVSQGCGADMGFLLENFPLSRALPALFRGTGECSEVKWKFLTLSIPEWALVWFLIFFIVALIIPVKARRF